MGTATSTPGPAADLDARLLARRAKRASKAARTAHTAHLAGGALIAAGVLLLVGEATEMFEGFPYLGGALIGFGSFVWWLGSPEAERAARPNH